MKIKLNSNIINNGKKIMNTISQLKIRKGRPHLICGDSAAGKSLFCAYIALGISGGNCEILENNEKGKKVVVLDLEQEEEDITSSYSRILNGMTNSDSSLFEFIQENITILQERGNYFEDKYSELEEYCKGASLLIIDNLTRIRTNLKDQIDENSQDMGKIMERLTKLSTDTNCAIIVIHHTGHRGSDRGRGSTAISNGAGQIFELENKGNNKFELCVTQDRFNSIIKKMQYSLLDCGTFKDGMSSELKFVNINKISNDNNSSNLEDGVLKIISEIKEGISQSDILLGLRNSGISFANNTLKKTITKLEKDAKIITVNGKSSGGRTTVLYKSLQNNQ